MTPAEEKAEAANKASKLQRAKVHGDYTCFKATHGQDVVALRSAIVDESQKTWLAESKDVSCMQAKRSKEAHRGIPMTKVGACCTADHFMKFLKDNQDAKAKAKAEKDARMEARKNKKAQKDLDAAVQKELKQSAPPAKAPAKKNAKAPGAPKKKKRGKRPAHEGDSSESEDDPDDGGININPPEEDEDTAELPPVGATIELEDPEGGWAVGLKVIQYEKDGSATMRRLRCLCASYPFHIALRITPPLLLPFSPSSLPIPAKKETSRTTGSRISTGILYINATTAGHMGIRNCLVKPAVPCLLLAYSRGMIAI